MISALEFVGQGPDRPPSRPYKGAHLKPHTAPPHA